MSEIANHPATSSIARRILRAALWIVAAIIAVGIVAPFIDATGFSAPVQENLQAWLGRDVKFEKVHFTLFSGPGFSLENVTIGEDPQYGLEPFAYVPTLEARLRLDKLLMGRLVFSSLRLVDPSLNLVKRNDGTWNVVALLERFSTPRRAPLNFFPSFEVSSGRIDFKFDTRKTTLYLLDSDLSVYPERSGKLRIQFSGSPARTDRAGMGFGHLRANAHWDSSGLDADVSLDPSNLSELTTLIQGQDLGVHGTVSSQLRIKGPLAALQLSGELRLDDVHRWDLLPSRGETWRIRYQGAVDLMAHQLNIETLPWHAGEVNPVAIDVRAGNFLNRPAWSVVAQFNHAPVQNLLPLGRRMGLGLPEHLALDGSLEGVLGYSSADGLSGRVAIHNATATLPDTPPVRAAALNATLSANRIHVEPTEIQTDRGTFEASGDYFLASQRLLASLNVEEFPLDALKSTIHTWFGEPGALAILNSGDVTGSFRYTQEETRAPSWSGQFQFTDATLHPPGIATPLDHAQGRVSFDDSTFDLAHFSSTVAAHVVRGSYHYNAAAKHPERLHLELPSADLQQIESELSPTLEAQGLLVRLRLSKRSIPPWLAARNLDGDLTVGEFSIDHTNLGPLTARFLWKGTELQFTTVQLNLPEGLIRARGTVDIASYAPRYRFTTKVTGFPWRGGLLNAQGDFESSGMGTDMLQNLHATGTFSGQDVMLSVGDAFDKVAGGFEFSFADGWPNLRLSNIEASDGEEAWNGAAMSQSDGKLIFELEHAGRQRRVISSLVPESGTAVSELKNWIDFAR